MNCLVTGGAGFIGSHLVDGLLKEGHKVMVIDNFDDYYSRKLQNLMPHKNNDAFELIEGSILNLDLLRKAMRDVDVVFHEAAQAGVRFSVQNPIKVHETNCIGTLNVLIAARDVGVKKVINASSSSVYGDAKELPLKEDMNPEPISPYGVSKLIAEHYCRLFYKLYALRTVSLRYFTVFGERQRPDMAIRIFVDALLENKRPRVFGDGNQTRDFTYVRDIVEANILCMKSSRADGEVLNIGRGESITVNALLELIAELMNKNLNPVYEDRQVGDVEHTLADITKAKELLGWKPKVSLKEGLRRFIEWYVLSAR